MPCSSLTVVLLLNFAGPRRLILRLLWGLMLIILNLWVHLTLLFVVQSLSLVWPNPLQPHGLKHARLLWTLPPPGVCSDSHLLSRWFYLTISSSAALFSFSLQSFPASESFPKCQLFASGSQSVGVSASASVLPMNIHDWFSLVVNWLVWSSCPRDSQESSPAPQFESINSLALSFLYGPTLFNFMAAVTIHSDLGACENKIYHCFHVCPFYLPLVMSCHIMTCHIMDATILVFFNVEFQASFFNSFLSPTSRG